MTAAQWFAGGERIPYDPKAGRVMTEEEAAATPGGLRVFESVAAAAHDEDDVAVWLTLLPESRTAPTARRGYTAWTLAASWCHVRIEPQGTHVSASGCVVHRVALGRTSSGGRCAAITLASDRTRRPRSVGLRWSVK
jgi:hypothetical protein